MERLPSFIGRKYTPEEIKSVTGALGDWAHKAKEKVPNEIEKSTEDIELIDLANQLIQKELETLGVSGYLPVSPDSVHFVSTMEETDPEDGYYTSVTDTVVVCKRDEGTRPELMAIVVHELIHRASYKRFHASPHRDVTDARVGYRIRSAWKEPLERAGFKGFNEFIVETTTNRIMRLNKQTLDMTIGEINDACSHYQEFAATVTRIVEKVAEHKKLSESEVFRDFERGQFQPSMLVLKDVEAVFGKGSVEVLSYMGVLTEPAAREKVDLMIEDYFHTDDTSERTAIAKALKSAFHEARHTELEFDVRKDAPFIT